MEEQKMTEDLSHCSMSESFNKPELCAHRVAGRIKSTGQITGSLSYKEWLKLSENSRKEIVEIDKDRFHGKLKKGKEFREL